MSEILIKGVQDLNEAITALRLNNEKKDGESQAVVEKIQLALDNQEIKNQELLKKLKEKENAISHYPILGYWLDIGKHSDFLKAQEDIKHINLY